MKNVWVFGSTGQLGFYLCEQLGSKAKPISHVDLDLSNTSNLRGALDKIAQQSLGQAPDVVINATAYNLVDKAETDRMACARLNEEVPKELAAWSKEYGALFIHYSTDFVFSGEGELPWRETDRPQPLNFYGQTKLDGEKAVLSEHPGALVFRTSWVYSHRRENFVLTVLKKALQQNELSIVSDQVGSPTYASDLAAHSISAAEQALVSGKSVGGVYHLSDAGYVSRYDFAKEILRCASEWEPKYKETQVIPVLTSDFKAVANRPLNSRLSLEKVQQQFGIQIKPWQQNLRESLRRHYGLN